MKTFRIGLALLMFAVLGTLSLAEDAKQEKKAKKAPIRPDRVIQLFNGKDLSGFYSWLTTTKYEDPKKVFTVQDGMIRVSGDGFGYIVTKDEYRDYRLLAEFKWGDETWAPRKNNTRDSGILVHCVGPDGNSGAWMASIEYQLIEGGTGDFIVVGGKYEDGTPVPSSLTAEVTKDRDGEAVWKKGGERQTFKGGRVNWFGRDPDWKDVLNFRGKDDVEKPVGEWNSVEVICDGGKITNILNGTVVNEGYHAFPEAGKIIFQTEGAEIFFRKIELHPLKK